MSPRDQETMRLAVHYAMKHGECMQPSNGFGLASFKLKVADAALAALEAHLATPPAPSKEPAAPNLGPNGSADRYFYEQGFAAGLRAAPQDGSKAPAAALEFDEDTQWILGLPNFWCAGIAHRLVKLGLAVIPPKAEDEQAFVLHWLLSLYVKHGSNFRDVANAELRGPSAPLQQAGEST